MEPGQGKEVYGLQVGSYFLSSIVRQTFVNLLFQISFSALPRDVDVRVIRDTDAVEVKHEV